jgi:hypothetical protein
METHLFTTLEAAYILGVSKAFLERDRWAGAKVPFIKIGRRAVRYRMQDISDYIESRSRKSTSDSGTR